ncbi:MAG: hypothetical protein HQK65_02350 [Desulfamplus sp.]|nr:hypothetical protein [Desulfamplus sp.]
MDNMANLEKQSETQKSQKQRSAKPASDLPIAWSCSDIIKAIKLYDDKDSNVQSELSRTMGEHSCTMIDKNSLTNNYPDVINDIYLKNLIDESTNNLDKPIFTSVSTDSRTITDDQLFIALKGERFDGHLFIPDLVNRGIKGFVVEKSFYKTLSYEQKKAHMFIFPVNDTLTALGMLARFQRIRSNVKLLAITGSSGKTTTRKMAASIFEQHFKTLSTEGNLNNEIGLPLTLLKLTRKHEWAVVEMGMNHKGEISRLSAIALPDIAMVTNTTDAHLEGLGTVNDVARAKAEITEGMNPGSTLIINRDDPRWQIIADKAKKHPNISNILFFGSNRCVGIDGDPIMQIDSGMHINSRMDIDSGMDNSSEQKIEKNHFSATDVVFNPDSITFTLQSNMPAIDNNHDCHKNLKIRTPAPFMLHNAIAASAAALIAGIPASAIQKGLLMFEPAAGRMKIINLGQYRKKENRDRYNTQNTDSIQTTDRIKDIDSKQVRDRKNNQHEFGNSLYLIDDTYNANPGSVKAALETLQKLGRDKESIAILADMLELGKQSPKLHFKIGQEASQLALSRLYVHGNMVSELILGALEAGFSKEKIMHGTKEEIIIDLLDYIQKGEKKEDIWILVKGSRGMKMEQIVEALMTLKQQQIT